MMNLEAFLCQERSRRLSTLLTHPQYPGRIMATDGKILVWSECFDAMGKVTKEIEPRMLEYIAPYFNVPTGQATPLSTLIIPEEEMTDCSECKGTGLNNVCPDCENSGRVGWDSELGVEYDEECVACNGRGIITEKSDYWAEFQKYMEKHGTTIDCEECDGSGKTHKVQVLPCTGYDIDAAYLRRLRDNLEDVELFLEVKPLDPVPFTFKGGCGVVMPRRQQ